MLYGDETLMTVIFNEQYYKNQNYIFYFSASIFLILGIWFLLAGRLLRLQVKNYNEDLERSLRGRLIYASWILSIPFISRAIYNILSASLDFEQEVRIIYEILLGVNTIDTEKYMERSNNILLLHNFSWSPPNNVTIILHVSREWRREEQELPSVKLQN